MTARCLLERQCWEAQACSHFKVTDVFSHILLGISACLRQKSVPGQAWQPLQPSSCTWSWTRVTMCSFTRVQMIFVKTLSSTPFPTQLRNLLTPHVTVLHFHSDANSVILGPSLSQRLLQSVCVEHKTIVEAASNIVHLQERTTTKICINWKITRVSRKTLNSC